MELKKDLPDIFEQFEESRQNGFLEAKKMKENGKPLIGTYCTFFPQEIAAAMGITTLSLCAFSNETIPEAETVLPLNLCPLIKSSYGFAKSSKCPYFYFADLIVGETTCDGKKKMFELLSEYKDVYVMHLPNLKDEMGLLLWKHEMLRLTAYLESKFERTLTDEDLWKAIRTKNRERQALKDFNSLMELKPAPFKGSEMYSVLYGSSYNYDKEELYQHVQTMIQKIKAEYRPEERPNLPRIIVTGCPIGGDTEKIIRIIEENGGQIVGFENCGGAKAIEDLVDETLDDPYEALARKYLNIGCSCMTPNPNRLALLDRMINDYQADAVIDVVLHACHTYNVEGTSVCQFVTQEKELPYLKIETDYSMSDIGQLTTRITAFIEMLG